MLCGQYKPLGGSLDETPGKRFELGLLRIWALYMAHAQAAESRRRRSEEVNTDTMRTALAEKRSGLIAWQVVQGKLTVSVVRQNLAGNSPHPVASPYRSN